jgi:hypothetical protein
MPFTSYATVADVARAHQVSVRIADFVKLLDSPPSEVLRQQLTFAQQFVASEISEWATCENLIYPVLQDIWKAYTDDMVVWSHVPIYFDEDLSGTPDYVIARVFPLGRSIPGVPYLVVVEAKRDDFLLRGWAQCLAAMLAAQKLHNLSEVTVYGIATNGILWQFGKLEGPTVTKDTRSITLTYLEDLCGAVRYLFEQSRAQVLSLARSA